MKTVLFLCTGNYYRSRFAEEYFNHRVQSFGLAWTAASRGLAIDGPGEGASAFSRVALDRLVERGASVRAVKRPPQQCTAADLATAQHIVALDGFEHRSMIRRQFPAWTDRVEYWYVGDMGVAAPADALEHIEERIEALILRLPAR